LQEIKIVNFFFIELYEFFQNFLILYRFLKWGKDDGGREEGEVEEEEEERREGKGRRGRKGRRRKRRRK